MASQLQLAATRKQLQLEKYGTHLSGFLVAAHTPGYEQEAEMPLPMDLRELKMQLAEVLGMQLASLRLRARLAESSGQVDQLWAEIDSQADLIAALEECSEAGMHRLVVEARGRDSRRRLDALGAMLGLLSSATFIFWSVTLSKNAPDSEWAGPTSELVGASLVANGAVAAVAVAAVQSSELAEWLQRGWPLLLLSFLSCETVLLVSSGVGCAAPLPSAARRGVLLWGSLALLALRALALYVVQAAMAEEEGAAAFAQMGLASALPSVCAALLGASALLSAAFVATQLALGCCRQFGVEGPPRPAAKPKPKPPSKAEEEAAAAADAAAAAERLAAASAGAAAALAIALEEGTNGRPAAKPKPKPKAGKKPKAKAAEMV